jgi:hypothetical protein
MNKKPLGNNGYHGVGVSDAASPKSTDIEPGEDFSGLKYVDAEENPPPGGGPKASGGKRRRLVRGFLVLAALALIVIGFFFWISGSGRKKIDLAVRDRSAHAEQPTPQKIDDVTAQAIAEVRGGSSAPPQPAPAAATSVETATGRDTTPAPIPLGGTVASVEGAPASNGTEASSAGASARPPDVISKPNTERSIRCAPVLKPSAPSSKQTPRPDLARAPAAAPPAPPTVLEKTVTLPPFGALLPVRTLGAIYTLRPSLSRFELTRDVRGEGWMMKKGTILVGQQRGSEIDRAYVSLTGFIDPSSGKFVRLSGDALGADGAPGLRGKRRRLSSRWARVLSRAATAAVTLGQAALSRGGTIVNVPGAVSPEIQGFSSSAVNAREFVEVSAGAAAFVLVTDLPKEIRGVDPQPSVGEGVAAQLGDEELVKLVTDGSPEQIRAALPRMTPELRQVAEAVLRESNNTDAAEGPDRRKR